MSILWFLFFFFNDTATTEIYTLSLHDALPIYRRVHHGKIVEIPSLDVGEKGNPLAQRSPEISLVVLRIVARRCCTTRDRKSTRLNSSHSQISYAVFCLKQKNIIRMFMYVSIFD